MKELLAKVPIGLFLGLYLAYLGYDYYGFVSDPESQLIQKKVQIAELKKQNAQLQDKVRKAEEFYKNLDRQKAQIRDLSQQLAEMKATVSEELDVAGFLKMVVTEARKVGLTIKGLKPTDTKNEEYYAEHRFVLNFHAVYVQLIVFLERMSNIQKIVRVDNFSIKPVSATRSRYVELEGSIELKAYRYLASKADDIGRGDAKQAPGAGDNKNSVNPGAQPVGAGKPSGGGA